MDLIELIRLDDCFKDAILLLMRYVGHVTGQEPTQEEMVDCLNSYFIKNEIANQIKYLLKKEPAGATANTPPKPFWNLNLMTGSSKNALARAGYYLKEIEEGVHGIRLFCKKTLDIEPSDEILSLGLMSSFILSEVKNHIEHLRKDPDKQEFNL